MEYKINKMARAMPVILALCGLLALSGTVSADPYLGGVPLATVEEGVVSGDLWFNHSCPMATAWSIDYPLPSYSDVAWARLYVVVYCGNMKNNYTGRANITFNGVQLGGTPDNLSSEEFNVSYSYPGEGGTGPVWVNDHCVRVTSDYLMWYDVTDLVQATSNVTVTTWPTDASFDGRIKGVTLVVAYHDGDSDTVHYWINQGHDTDSYLYSGDYIGETNFTVDLPSASDIPTATLTVVHLASSDGNYTFNGGNIPADPSSTTTPPGENWQGSSSGYNVWTVPALINSTSNNSLTYNRTGNYYKLIQSFLTVNYTVATVAPLPDLNVTAITVNPDYSAGHKELFANESNTIQTTITNLDPSNASSAFNVSFAIEGVDTWRVRVDGLAAGASTNLAIQWTPDRGGTVVLSPVTFNLTVTADCDGEVSETDETNNVFSKTLFVYNNGYKGKRYTGGHDIETKHMEPLRGNLIYSKGTSLYQSGGSGWTSYTVNWASGDLPVPDSAAVKQARLYVYYTWDPSGINASMNFNGHLFAMSDLDAHYIDAKGYGSYHDHKYGTMVYNVKNYFNTSGNTASLTKVVANDNVALYGMLLVLVYEDASEPERLIWLNEECDLLTAKAGYGTNETEATAYAPFSGSIDITRVNAAALVTVVPGGDSGAGNEDRLYFNAGEWDNLWEGSAGKTISINETDVIGYLLADSNLARLQSRGDGFMATNAFLVVQYTEEGGEAAAFGVGDARGRSGTYVEVPVNITNVRNGPVQGIRCRIAYNESVLNLTSIGTGDLTSNWANIRLGEDRHTMALATAYTQDAIANGSSGSVIILTFYVTGSPGATSPMELTLIELSNPDGFVDTAAALNGTFVVASLGAITGRITYACNGTGIAGVTVNLTEDNAVKNTTVTNETGYYDFSAILPGNYVITAAKPRFWDNSTGVDVLAGETALVDMMLWLKGDLNNNGNVADAGDVVLMLRASVGDIPGDLHYDLNGNGSIADAGDVVLLLRASVGDLELL